MKVSVILSTYNGEKYILPLMFSLLDQTYKIDEVLISDDCSNDSTCLIVKKFIADNNLQNTWKFTINERNVGWKENFKKLIKESHSDYIFPCDQDDIWEKNKIELMTDVMEKHPEIGVLASNYRIFTKALYEKEKIPMKDDKSIKQIESIKQGFYVTRPGCVYCIRSQLIGYLDKYGFEDCPHDAFFWRVACLLGKLYIYNYPTINYRRHNGTVTGNDKGPDYNKKVYSVNFYEKMLNVLINLYSTENLNDTKIAKNLDEMHNWANLRTEMYCSNKKFNILRLLKFISCYQNKAVYCRDIYYIFMEKSK